MRVLLIGGTDLTVVLAETLHRAGLPPAACVGVGSAFSISYSAKPIASVRQADIAGWARSHDVPYRETTNIDAIVAFSKQLAADLCLVAGWYHFVPDRLRSQFRFGAWGLHASLLPELRGGAPLNWAILKGLDRTGITLFALGDGVDDGPILDQREIPIHGETSIGDLVRASTSAACEMVISSLPRLVRGELRARPQTGIASYGLQRIPEDGRICWREPREAISRLIRAASEPYQGAFTTFENRTIRVWEAQKVDLPRIFGAHGQIAVLPDTPHPAVLTGTSPISIRRATFEDQTDAMPVLKKANNRRLD